jgi:ubiquinol-cytochrome c reductase iron-sulfur subunit
VIAAAFAVSALSSAGLTVVYIFGGQVQLEGVLLGGALGGLAVGLILWAKQLMPGGHFVQERSTTPGEPDDRLEAARTFETGEEQIERRGFLGKMVAAAVGALGVAALFPIRSLGTRPGRELFTTEWRPGVRVVTIDNTAVRPETLDVGGVLTVFPENFTQTADSQTLLIRLAPGEYEPSPGREEWAPMDNVAFSKVCTHAGCPVGLYQPSSHELFCPCHQSAFNVLDAAAPTAGPATRPLPQLPLAVDENGFLIASGDYPEPVGPGFWSRPGG